MSLPLRGLSLWAAVSLGVLCAADPARAAGFYIKEMSVTGLGRAFAGAPAAADDASTVWFNPAGMTSLPANEVDAAVNLIAPQLELTNDGSKRFNGVGFQPTADTSPHSPYDATPVPNLFGVLRDADRGFALGIGVTAPFGMANEYPENWFGRFDSIETDLKTINYSLVGAYDINRYFTIGGGIDYQTVDVTLTSMKNAVTRELYSKLEGNDNGEIGFNLGILAHVTPDTQVGFSYRSGFTHKLEGTATLRSYSSNGPLYGNPYAAKADLNLPALASLGVKHRLNDKVTLLGDVSYYGWSAFDAIKVYRVADDSLREDVPQNYKDTVSFGVGLDYAFDDALTFRAGVQYDPTPTRDGFRTSRTPDSDRTWLSGGLTYKVSNDLLLDAALTYIHLADTKLDLNRSASVGGQTTAVVGADVKGYIGIAALALRYRF